MTVFVASRPKQIRRPCGRVPGASEPLTSGLFSGLSHAGETDHLEEWCPKLMQVPRKPRGSVGNRDVVGTGCRSSSTAFNPSMVESTGGSLTCGRRDRGENENAHVICMKVHSPE